MRPRYHYREVGGMFRIAAIQAAVLDVKLRYLDGWHAARRANAAEYDRLLAGSAVVTPKVSAGNVSVYNQYVVRVPDRDRVRQSLADAGVGAEVYYPFPLHTQPCFADLGYRTGDFPVAERLCGDVLALPVYPELPADQLRYAADQLRRALPNA